MEENKDFLNNLEQALRSYRDYLNKEELPRMKEEFVLFKSLFDGITATLLKKGLISEDPYKYEEKISEVTIPPVHQVIESEVTLTISQRLSQFERQLDFLNHFFQFDADFMTLPRIKNISSLLAWIKWENLEGSGTSPNTKMLNSIIKKITQGNDTISKNLILNSSKKISSVVKKLMGRLKKVSIYQKEKYKFEVRTLIMSPLNLGGKNLEGNDSKTLQTVRANIRSKLPQGSVFIKSLVLEIIDEEISDKGTEKKNEVLKRLEIKKKVKKKKTINYKPVLMDAVRSLGTASRPLNDALKKLQENNNLVENRSLTFGEKFRRWISGMSKKKSISKFYVIEYFNEDTSSNIKQKIDFTSFLENGYRETRILSALYNKNSMTYQKLVKSTEENILSFMDKHISALKDIAAKMDPLNIFFKSELPREDRTAIKGVKIEVSSIKETIHSANKKRLEYIAKVEEIEQMKKLGIDPSID